MGTYTRYKALTHHLTFHSLIKRWPSLGLRYRVDIASTSHGIYKQEILSSRYVSSLGQGTCADYRTATMDVQLEQPRREQDLERQDNESKMNS